MTATCARFAASATRLKSLSSASVEGVAGAGAATVMFVVVGDCWMEEEVAELGLDGDEIGASIAILLGYIDCSDTEK